jgi:hypothetical protein
MKVVFPKQFEIIEIRETCTAGQVGINVMTSYVSSEIFLDYLNPIL